MPQGGRFQMMGARLGAEGDGVEELVCPACGHEGLGAFTVAAGFAVCTRCGEQHTDWREELIDADGLGNQAGARRNKRQRMVDREAQELLAAEAARRKLGPRSNGAYLEGVQLILRQQVVHMQAAGGCREGLEDAVWMVWKALLRSSEAAGRSGTEPPADLQGKSEGHHYFLELKALSQDVPVECTLGTLLLGCMLQQDAVLPHDVFWRAYTGDLPFLAAFRSIPARLSQYLPAHFIERLRPQTLPNPHWILNEALRLAAVAGVGPTIGFNVPALICRGVSDLKLPSNVAKAAIGLYGLHLDYFSSFFEVPVRDLGGFRDRDRARRYGATHLSRSRNAAAPPCALAALLLAALKLTFGLCEGRLAPVLTGAGAEPALGWRGWARAAVQRLDDRVTAYVVPQVRGDPPVTSADAVPPHRLRIYLKHLKDTVFAGGEVPAVYSDIAQELSKLVEADSREVAGTYASASGVDGAAAASDLVKVFDQLFPEPVAGASGGEAACESPAHAAPSGDGRGYMIYDWHIPFSVGRGYPILPDKIDLPVDFAMALTVVAAHAWYSPQDVYDALVSLERRMMGVEGVAWPETRDAARLEFGRSDRLKEKAYACAVCGAAPRDACPPDCSMATRRLRPPRGTSLLATEEGVRADADALPRPEAGGRGGGGGGAAASRESTSLFREEGA